MLAVEFADGADVGSNTAGWPVADRAAAKDADRHAGAAATAGAAGARVGTAVPVSCESSFINDTMTRLAACAPHTTVASATPMSA